MVSACSCLTEGQRRGLTCLTMASPSTCKHVPCLLCSEHPQTHQLALDRV